MNLIEHVLPTVPLRQWVLTLPFELRGRLGFDGKLLGTVARLFVVRCSACIDGGCARAHASTPRAAPSS